MKETLTIRLDKSLAKALAEEDRLTGLTKSEITRQAPEARLRHGSKLRVMSRYFGIASGPSDLSTNKAYRQKQRSRSLSGPPLPRP